VLVLLLLLLPLSISHYCSIAKIRFDHRNLVVQFDLRHFSVTDLAAPRRQVPAQPLRIEQRWKQTALCSVDQLTGQALAQYSWPSTLWTPIVRCTTFNSKSAPTPFERVSLHRRPDTFIASIRRRVLESFLV